MAYLLTCTERTLRAYDEALEIADFTTDTVATRPATWPFKQWAARMIRTTRLATDLDKFMAYIAARDPPTPGKPPSPDLQIGYLSDFRGLIHRHVFRQAKASYRYRRETPGILEKLKKMSNEDLIRSRSAYWMYMDYRMNAAQLRYMIANGNKLYDASWIYACHLFEQSRAIDGGERECNLRSLLEESLELEIIRWDVESESGNLRSAMALTV